MSDAERYVLHRIVRAEGDPDIIAADVRFSSGSVDAALGSLQSARRVITDVRMVQVGISRAALNRREVTTACLIDAPEVAERARREGTTPQRRRRPRTGPSNGQRRRRHRQRPHGPAGAVRLD